MSNTATARYGNKALIIGIFPGILSAMGEEIGWRGYMLPALTERSGLTYMSKSVWPAAFLHAAHNNYDQAVFGLITRGDDMMYYVSETGFLTIICAWAIAIIIIVKIKEISSDEEK